MMPVSAWVRFMPLVVWVRFISYSSPVALAFDLKLGDAVAALGCPLIRSAHGRM